MKMYHLRVAFVLLATVVVVWGSNKMCLRKVGPPFRHYTELGCKPVFKGCCIEQFDCPFIKNPPGPDKCYFKGRNYNDSEYIQDDLGTICMTSCSCMSGGENPVPRFNFGCAMINCLEYMLEPEPDKKDCFLQYSLNSCCSDKNDVCGAKAFAALKTCTWDSKNTTEGRRFWPSGSCQRCLCTKDFDGTLRAPYCEDLFCGIGIPQTIDFGVGSNLALDKCGPIYVKLDDCCPVDWKCASATDKITRKPGNNCKTRPKCHYGDKLLNIGDTVQGGNKCVTCSCDIPPLISCVRKANCTQ